jgi:hypothetical protein
MSYTMRPSGPREFTMFSHDGGFVLCDKTSGAILCIKYPQELAQLRQLLNAIEVVMLPKDES